MKITTKSEQEIFKKPNAALVMVPKTGSISPTSRKMYNVLIHKTQNQIREIEATIGVVPAGHLFEASLTDIVSSFATQDSDPRTIAIKYLREMRRAEVDWRAPDAGTDVVWASLSLLSEARIVKRNGHNWVLWAFPPTIFSSIEDPANQYTLLDLSNISKLKGYIAVALYEICSRYKNSSHGHTSKNSPEWWVDALTATPASIDPATGKKRPRREWRKIKSAGVIQAIAEINQKTDINIIDLIEIKSGKAVVEVQFVVEKKKVQNENIESPKISSTIALAASKTQISLDTIAKLSQSGCTDEEIEYSLGKLDIRNKRADLVRVENEAAYLKSVLNDVQGRIIPQQVKNISVVVGGDIEPIPLSPVEQRRKESRIELLGLEKADQKTYFEAGFEILKSKGLAGAFLTRKFNQGEWDTTALIAAAVEAYSIEKEEKGAV